MDVPDGGQNRKFGEKLSLDDGVDFIVELDQKEGEANAEANAKKSRPR